MNTKSVRISPSNPDGMTFCQSLSRRAIFSLLDRIEDARLTIIQGDETFELGSGGELSATIHIHDPACYKRFLHGGDIEAGRTYFEGQWDTSQLVDLCRIFARNREILRGNRPPGVWLFQPFQRLYQWFRRNSRSGSKKNIREHYDLGNQFFETFLDPTLSYSSARFPDSKVSLFEASVHKMKQIIKKLELSPSDRLLEIGTGWGGMAVYAAREAGCQVTTTTISDQQYKYACEKVSRENLEERVTVLNKDYRDLEGQYDALVSIEMIEAVGDEYLDTFFRRCDQLLKAGGRVCLQAITVPDRIYDRYRRSTDFIRHFIFPGGCLPSVARMLESVQDHTQFQIKRLETAGADYAETLRRWRQRFLDNTAEIEQMGFDKAFIRMWEYYLCYCEAGFHEQTIDSTQLFFEKNDV